MVKPMEQLKHYTSVNQKDWDRVVNFAVFVMDTAKNETTGYSTFELIYGLVALSPIDLSLNYQGFCGARGSKNIYAESLRYCLDKAREIAAEKCWYPRYTSSSF